MPSNLELYNEAEKLKDDGKLPEAAVKLEELIKQDEKYSLAHSALAIIYGKLGRHEEAVQQAQIVCQLEPDDAFSFTALSVICQRAGKIQEAEDAMARARAMEGHHH